ncbi:MAG: NUDIX hydrolase, partial [Thermoplasmata archaeon]|nr:NUDIX hydrolase [Thermoplasmata archaeon]
MLLELPTADEIDDMAERTPSLTVRRYEFNLLDREIDLNYTPCKGEVVIVTRRKGGIVLVRAKGTAMWTLPAARIRMDEMPEDAARRVALERCGLKLTGADLKAFYDVTRHYQNVSVKRLFVVYGCST